MADCPDEFSFPSLTVDDPMRSSSEILLERTDWRLAALRRAPTPHRAAASSRLWSTTEKSNSLRPLLLSRTEAGYLARYGTACPWAWDMRWVRTHAIVLLGKTHFSCAQATTVLAECELVPRATAFVATATLSFLCGVSLSAVFTIVASISSEGRGGCDTPPLLLFVQDNPEEGKCPVVKVSEDRSG